MRTASLLSLVLFAGSGCVLQRAPIIPEQDTGPRPDTGFDAGIDMRDVPPGFDGGVDTGIDVGEIDGGGIDTGMPDTGIDAGMPDTGVDSGMPDTGVDAPPPRPTCEELFSGGNRTLCAEADVNQCRFVIDRPGVEERCADACAAVAGSSCVDGWRTDGTCATTGDASCTDMGNDRICLCTRP